MTIGNLNGNVTINGLVQNGVIATNGSINGALMIGGPLSNGQLVSAGNINGNVTINGSLERRAHRLLGLDHRQSENQRIDRQAKRRRLGRFHRQQGQGHRVLRR